MKARLGLGDGPFAFVTLHRPSNVDDAERLSDVTAFLEKMAGLLTIVFPIHPRTEGRLREFGRFDRLAAIPGLRCLPPFGYHDALGLMCDATVAITDSGGIQEETSFLRVPCLTIRENTERPITVTLGTNTVVGSDWPRAEAAVREVLAGRYKTGQTIAGWDGHAADRVTEILLQAWGD